MTFTRDEVCAVARRHHVALREIGGVSPELCVVLAVAELGDAPLDPFDFDDAAIVVRAETLVIDGMAASEALATARAECATWAERAGGVLG